MPYIENSTGKEKVSIYYEDYGQGKPVILIHGWPLSGSSWESQVGPLVSSGHRCITYDRRGFGKSSRPWGDYDYSTLASDLNELIVQLKLNDCILVGFSMGGGEVVRYITEYGEARIKKAVLVSSIIPLMKKKEDNPEGVPEKDLKDILKALADDRVGFLKKFHQGFYNYNKSENSVSAAQLEYDFSISAPASPRATIETARAWMDTDFRKELKDITVPVLIIHGDADATVPLETSARQAAAGISGSKLKIISGAPHGLNITHSQELNEQLLPFFKN